MQPLMHHADVHSCEGIHKPAIAAAAHPPEEGRRGRSPPRPPARADHGACASVCRQLRLGPAMAGTPQQGPRSRRQRAGPATSRCPLLLPPTVSRWLGSSALTYAAISFTQPSSTLEHRKQRGSLMRFQPVMHGVCNRVSSGRPCLLVRSTWAAVAAAGVAQLRDVVSQRGFTHGRPVGSSMLVCMCAVHPALMHDPPPMWQSCSTTLTKDGWVLRVLAPIDRVDSAQHSSHMVPAGRGSAIRGRQPQRRHVRKVGVTAWSCWWPADTHAPKAIRRAFAVRIWRPPVQPSHPCHLTCTAA